MTPLTGAVPAAGAATDTASGTTGPRVTAELETRRREGDGFAAGHTRVTIGEVVLGPYRTGGDVDLAWWTCTDAGISTAEAAE
mmetsp:Transcript_62868/g.136120  ORF Transcript_62868/g.136120 Transcript_62868/m.136120 type:complete len:83 (+) Transcript_62868:3-251(+)